jgi:hypothetical protein
MQGLFQLRCRTPALLQTFENHGGLRPALWRRDRDTPERMAAPHHSSSSPGMTMGLAATIHGFKLPILAGMKNFCSQL